MENSRKTKQNLQRRIERGWEKKKKQKKKKKGLEWETVWLYSKKKEEAEGWRNLREVRCSQNDVIF